MWTTPTGPGGNVNLNNYEQFTITANTNYTVRVDSLTLNSSFYNTSSNTKLAVLYSKAGFVSDINNITGGILGADGGTTKQSAAFLAETLLKLSRLLHSVALHSQ